VIAADLVASLAERGHELHVITDRAPTDEPAPNRGLAVTIDRYPFLDVLRSRSAVRTLSLARSIFELKRVVRPDVVLAFALTPSLYFHLQTRQACAAPLLVSLHGSLPFRAEIAQSVVGRTLADADWVMTCSESCRREAVNLYPFLAGRCSVAQNALKQSFPAVSRLSFDPPRLLYVGRLSREKGVDVAIAAMPAVLERAPGARLKVAGEGPLSLVLRDLAVQYGVTHAVEFLGFVAHDEVPRLLSTASIVVVPSRSEGFSMVALEAAQAARPVVAARVGGIPEVVVDGETGLLVATESPVALASAILQLIGDPAGAAVMAANARRRADEVFHWRHYVDAYDQRIRTLGRRQ